MSIEWKQTPLSMTEMGIYLDWRKNLQGTAYNVPLLLPLPKDVDIERVKTAVRRVLAAHPSMLSRFTTENGKVVRKTPCGDLTGLPLEIQVVEGPFQESKAILPFSDPEGELCRFTIIREKDGAALFMDIHHILFDGSSMPSFLEEMNRAYAGKDLMGESFPPAQFALREQKEREGEGFQREKEYYASFLSDCEICSSLIHDKEGGSPKSTYFDTRLNLDPEKIADFVKANGIRTSTFFTGAYGYLLGRFSGSTQTLFSTIFHGRNKETAKEIGMFVRTLPVLEDFEKGESIIQHLKSLDEQINKSRQMWLFSYADICGKFQLSIPTLFAYQGDIIREFDFLSEKITPAPLQSEDPKEEVVGEVFRSKDGYILRLSYRTDLYERESLEAFADSFEKTVSEFLDKQSFEEVSITSDQQMSRLDGFLCPPVRNEGPADIVSMFRRQAKEHPENTALILGDLKKTYREIEEESDKIAFELNSRGIGSGKVVSILIHRNMFMVTATLGVLKSGAAYQPLDPTYPPERLLFMVQDASTSLVVADEDLTGLLAGYEGEFLLTKEVAGLASDFGNWQPPIPAGHDLFTLLYTSGSTGTPKGVMLEHQNLVNFCNWYQRSYGLKEGSVHAAYASYGFDANMMDLYPALTCGGTVCIVPEEMRLNLPELSAYFEKNQVSVAFMTTQVGRQFAASSYRPSTLKALSVGGERLASMAPPEGIDFFNVYGPTECTILATQKKIDREYLRIPIGKSVANAWLYVVDKNGKRLPPCVPGELWIAGPGVARGYLNRPEKDAEAFTPNPFSQEEGYKKTYHTGDIVRFLPNGDLDFIGRNDGQVKIRGFRIELSEIEAVIREHPSIEDATVVAYDNESGSGKYVVAYIVVKKGQGFSLEELKAFILQRKPPYMVPAFIMELEAIPLNQNQKVDKKKLPRPEHRAPKEPDQAREKTNLEKDLLKICGQVIGNQEFGIYTPLTEAGLTSISTMELMVTLKEHYNYSPEVNELLQGMRIIDIENALVSHWISNGAGKDLSSSPAGKEETSPEWAPLTQTQLGIYLECRMNETSDQYNIPCFFKLGAGAETERLCEALRKTVEAHPSLKCSIEPDKEAGAFMRSHKDLGWEVEVEETELSDQELEERVKKEPTFFKLDRAPLFRFKVYRTKSSVYLSLVFHHILMDGTSVAVFMEDLERAYQNEELLPESYDQLQLALEEKKRRSSEDLPRAKAVYDRILTGVSISSLPIPEKAASMEEKGKGAYIHFDIPGLSAEEVQGFCSPRNLTENAFFTAAFAYTLSKLSANEEVLFASIYNGRTRLETLRLLGMLVKTYPIYLTIDKEKSPEDFILEVQKRIMELTSNDLYSFAEAVRDYGVNADILFAYQGDQFSGFRLAGEEVKEIPRPLEYAKEPLSIDVWKKNGTYRITFEYRSDLYTAQQIQWICDLYGEIAHGLIKNSHLSEISLLSQRAKAFLDEVNDTDVHTSFRPVSRMFEECVATCPDRLALITPQKRLTYRELNESANRVAHALYDLGAKGHIVSLLLPRTEHVYMARQGILKAGGAFLSIVPDYPDERVRIMMEDSQSHVLIVNEELLSQRREFLESLSCQVVSIESLLMDERTDNLGLPASKEDIAYCIFTSGSTGKPKGVLLTQGNLFNFLDANPKNPEILGYTERGTVSLAMASITFDISIMEEFIPLTHAMTVCFTTEEEIHNPMALSRLMIENHVDMLTCTPSFLSNCIGLSVMKEALRNVKSYDFGAEAFPATLYDKITAINPEAYIMNGYGPTEATISCTMDVVTDTSLITIGRPSSNVHAYVLDEKDKVLPPLVPGELIITGEGVSKGYIGRPDLNQEKFFVLEGRPAYRTGDVVAWTSDGRLRFHGRSDNQVKLRGLRVELSEIENAINQVEDVLTSIVIMTGEENNKFLAGYYTASREISPDELREKISKTLTPYMVPGVLMQLPEMPLTQNHKIDKKRLPKVELVPEAYSYIPPENDVEKDFCTWFADVLHMDQVSAEGNFFDLGGTSLSASIIALNASEKGYNIVYADIFKAQTPRELAALVNSQEPQTSSPALTQIQDFDYSSLPLSCNQEEELTKIKSGSIGNLLLTGATGFLGIHVLHEYLTQETGKIYCLIRGEAPEQKLSQLYFYYFAEPLKPYFDQGRITVVGGDITDMDALERMKEYPFDTLINCAALVKHFVKDDSLEHINVQGVKNLIRLCKETGKRLIQTSTVSVAGDGIDGKPQRSWKLTEDTLYNGQLLENAYALSKFKAEKALLEAVNEGLDGKIMRLGNLMGRHSDGEFQVNFNSNAFIRTLSSYKALGAIPYSMLNVVTDFSEIDMTARAILLLSGTPREFTVFHPLNNHFVTYADILYSMREYGFKVDCVEEEDFAQRMKNAGNAASALRAYNSREGSERRYMLDQNCDFTVNALYRLGFKWPVSGEKYIVMMLKSLDELNMFENEES